MKVRLTEATKRYLRAQRALKEAREEAMTLALDLLRAGVGPAEVTRLSPFTDSHIRRAARDADLPPVTSARGASARSKP